VFIARELISADAMVENIIPCMRDFSLILLISSLSCFFSCTRFYTIRIELLRTPMHFFGLWLHRGVRLLCLKELQGS